MLCQDFFIWECGVVELFEIIIFLKIKGRNDEEKMKWIPTLGPIVHKTCLKSLEHFSNKNLAKIQITLFNFDMFSIQSFKLQILFYSFFHFSPFNFNMFLIQSFCLIPFNFTISLLLLSQKKNIKCTWRCRLDRTTLEKNGS